MEKQTLIGIMVNPMQKLVGVVEDRDADEKALTLRTAWLKN